MISCCYQFIPVKVEVEEHHIGVYSSKVDEHMVKAPHPRNLLRGSLVSPSLAAAIINGKYVNAVPLYRLEKEFERYGLAIPRQNMANWMIRLDEGYLGIMYDYLHSLLYEYHVIQADETPVLVNKDGRPTGNQSWMRVYRSGFMQQECQIILCEYQKSRNASYLRKFLKDYTEISVTDGYQVYHTLEKEREDLKIDGCFGFIAEDGDVSIDNNASERAIRGFCIGKKNWKMIDTINGATSSEVIYSIVETAKANNLKPYDYFEHLFTEIPKHEEDTNIDFLKA